jgi:hypothetical protein
MNKAVELTLATIILVGFVALMGIVGWIETLGM